jgi:hypothetical protein
VIGDGDEAEHGMEPSTMSFRYACEYKQKRDVRDSRGAIC